MDNDICMVCGEKASQGECPNGCQVDRCPGCHCLASLEDDGLCGECSYKASKSDDCNSWDWN
jgi:hypothetical protein